MKTLPRTQRAVVAIERVVASAETADELLEGVAAEVHHAVPHDGASWFGVDPVTMVATAPSRVEALDPGLCEAFWHLEFHEQDVAQFADLARGDGAAALRMTLDGRVTRSSRYREFMRPQGYDDELRGALRADGATWGVVGLYRESGRAPFDAEDIGVVKGISATIAGALRAHVRSMSPWLGQPSAPGLLVVDPHGRVLSANDEALCWLRDLWPTGVAGGDGWIEQLNVFALRDRECEVPTTIYALVSRARAFASGRERSPARVRLRDRRGRWLVLHASVLAGPATSAAEAVAIVIEAAKSAEIAPIIVEAYALTRRERDVLGAIARGGSTTEIAAELFISPHTVRDYVKTVFEKVGVASRGELVARLFGEHYSDRMHDTMVHID